MRLTREFNCEYLPPVPDHCWLCNEQIKCFQSMLGKSFFYPLLSHSHKNFIINTLICITELYYDLLIHLFCTVFYNTMQILDMIHIGFYSRHKASTSARSLCASHLVYESWICLWILVYESWLCTLDGNANNLLSFIWQCLNQWVQ